MWQYSKVTPVSWNAFQ